MNDKQRRTQFARRAMVHSVVRSSIDSTARQAESAAQRDASPSDNGENAIQSGVDQASWVVENTAYTSRRISYTRFRALQAKHAQNNPAADAASASGQVRREAFRRGRFRALAIEKQKQPNRKPPCHPLPCLCKRRRYLLVKSSGGRF